MDIVFVGAGRVATHLAKALYAGGHHIKAVYSRTITSAEILANEVNALPTNRIDALPQKADVFILSVKDSVLKDVISELRKGREQQYFLHTAGSIPMSVFGEHQHCGVFYPMQTFSKEKVVDFSRVYIFIEGSDADILGLARQLAETLTTNVYELTSSERRYLHLAAVFACNFTNHCYALSAQILESHGLPFESMLPLIKETADKVETVHPHKAQTGPAARRDMNVMDAQKVLLADNPQMQKIYDIMSKSIIETLDFND